MSRPLVEPFGHLSTGRPGALVTLENDILRVGITDYGARIASIEAPDRDGKRDHVLLGFDDVAGFETAGGSFGAVLGRCANRIGGARFMLDDHTYYLVANDGPSTLHGGAFGFGKLMWTLLEVSDDAVLLQLISPDDDQGFPGELTVQARYRLQADTLHLELTARADRPTMVNLSCHPYFNLAGVARHDVLGHEVTIEADAFIAVDARQIPTGELLDVAGTPLDFRRSQTLGARIREAHTQMLPGRGYDTCFVLRPRRDPARPVARVADPLSGRGLEISTTQPGLQLYSGNSLEGATVGRGGIIYRQSAGLALEAENFPDAPNQPDFPSAVLRPGEHYRQTISYRFTR